MARGKHRQKQNDELIDLIYELTVDPRRFEELVLEIDQRISNKSSLAASLRSKKTALEKQFGQSEDLNEHLKLPNELSPIIGHLERAMAIVQHISNLEKENSILNSFFDQLPIGLLLLDDKLSIISCNPAAYKELDIQGVEINRMALSDINTLLHSRLLNFQKEPTDKKDIATITLNSKRVYVTEQKTTNLNLKLNSKKFYAVLIPNDQFDIVDCHPDFSDHYDLSNRELQIINQLIKGQSIKEISKQDNVKEGTVRQQVKSIYSKTQTHSQSALISLALRNPATMITATLLNDYREKISSHAYKFIKLSSEKMLAYEEYGDGNGDPMFMLHNFGGCRWQTPYVKGGISQLNIRMVIPDRPGFGRSTMDPDLSYLCFADDLIALADYLKINKFNVLGYSSGTQSALALAYKYPDRIKRVILVGPSFSLKKGEEKRSYLTAALPKINKILFDIIYDGWKKKPDRYLDHVYTMAGSAEKCLFKSLYFRNQRISLLKESTRQGTAQILQELSLVNSDWGFDLAKINHTVEIWYGDEDYYTPVAAFERFARSFAKTKMTFMPGYGLFLYYAKFEEIIRAKINE